MIFITPLKTLLCYRLEPKTTSTGVPPSRAYNPTALLLLVIFWYGKVLQKKNLWVVKGEG